MIKYLVFAILLVLTASCASTDKDLRQKKKKEPVESSYKHMEKRQKSKTATHKFSIENTSSSFYYDNKSWTPKKDNDPLSETFTRRFMTAHISHYHEFVPMAEIYRKLISEYKIKNAKLIESEFIEVNKSVVIYNKIEGTLNKKEIVMLSYGFSEDNHTIITHGFTFKTMLRDETEMEIVEFLNGFVGND